MWYLVSMYGVFMALSRGYVHQAAFYIGKLFDTSFLKRVMGFR
jgi:hypothetical protein